LGQNVLGSGLIGQYQKGKDGKCKFANGLRNCCKWFKKFERGFLG